MSSQYSAVSESVSPYAYRKWCGVRRSTWLLAIYIVTYVSFLVVGGYLMALLEGDNEKRLKGEVHQKKKDFLEKYPQVNETELEELLTISEGYLESGISALDKNLGEENWSYGQSILFTVTVVTTIGYGHVTPLTSTGKLFCILYSVLGIPFTLIFLTASVQRLLEPTVNVLAFFFRRLGSRISPLSIRVIHLTAMSVTFMVLFIFIPAAVFCVIEDRWTYLDGVYFVFISLTTIGLGDYIPGDEEGQRFRELYKVSVAVYLLLGLVFMTLTATVFYDIPQLNLGTVLHQHKDIHLPCHSDQDTTVDESEAHQEEGANERTSLKKSVKRIFKKRQQHQVTPIKSS